MAWGKLNSGKDRVLANAERSSAADIICELIWNSIDADADLVDVQIDVSEFAAATSIRISDNGHGIDPDLVSELFLVEGDSHPAATAIARTQSIAEEQASLDESPLHGDRGALVAHFDRLVRRIRGPNRGSDNMEQRRDPEWRR